MSLVLVVSMLSLVPSGSPSTRTERAHALESPEELKGLEEPVVEDVDRDASGDARDSDEDPSRWRALLLGGYMAVLATVGANMLAYAAVHFLTNATIATWGVGSLLITGRVPDFSSSAPAFALGALAVYFVVFTLGMGFAIDLVTDGWISLVVAPVLGVAALLGPPFGAALGTALALGTLQAGLLLLPALLSRAPGVGASGLEWVVLGVAIVGITVSALFGGLVGYATTSFVLPVSVITLLADDPSEWRTPFTSFTE